jgi:hypothetical protein
VLDDHLAGAPAADALVHFAEVAGVAGFEVDGLAEQFDQFPAGTVEGVARETAALAAMEGLALHRVEVDIVPAVVAPRTLPALALGVGELVDVLGVRVFG